MPEIVESDGDIFASGCEALVDPVDCTGAQGAGLAKLFRMQWPEAAAAYKRVCGRLGMKPGDVWWFRVPGHHILFTATKAHWKDPSQLAWIRVALRSLIREVRESGCPSIAVPAIGCGEGGLPWSDVRPLILAAAERMPCERVVVYGPKPARPRRASR